MTNPTVTITIYEAGGEARGANIAWKSCNQRDMAHIATNLLHHVAASMATGDKGHYTAADYEAALQRLLNGARFIRENQDSKPNQLN